MRDSYCIENDFAAQKELAEKDSANIDKQWKDMLEFNALRLRAERSEAKLALWQKDMNEVLRQRDDLHARVARLEEALKRGIELHENCDADTCMCGESMLHPLSDHKPTAMLQYYGDQWAEEARRALEEK